MMVNHSTFRNTLESILQSNDGLPYEAYENSPLFAIIEYNSHIVAFSLLNNDLDLKEAISFNIFRQLYIENQRKWNNFDLNLVYCNTNNDIDVSKLNQVELDPYFCKKYVIDFTDSTKIGDQLRNLPFVPLLSNNIKIVNRPLTAKELLKQYGVDSSLIDSFIIRRTKSPETILNDCLKVKEIPKWNDLQVSSNLPKKDAALEIPLKRRLSKITINNFRAYKHKQFDFDADIVVLYGNNGLGKTSLFEAIDFACTGSVLRLDERKISKNLTRFNNVLKNLDSENVKDTFINFEINDGSKSEQAERYLNDRTRLISDNNSLDRKQAIEFISKLEYELLGMGTDELVSLFRATHLFGQELQGLITPKFMTDSILSNDLVSRMLSFQDYTEGINKGNDVLKYFKKILKDEKSIISEKQSEVNTNNIEISNYSGKYKTPKTTIEISSLRNILAEKLNNTSIIVPKTINSNILENIRIEFQKQLETKKSDLRIINKLFKMFDEYRKCIGRYEDNNKAIKQLEALDEKENKNKINFETDIANQGEQIKELNKSLKNNEAILENVQWLISKYDEYQRIIKFIEVKEKELKIRSEELNDNVKELQKCDTQKQKLELGLQENNSNLKQIEILITNSNKLLSKLEEYNSLKETIKNNNIKRKELLKKIDLFQEQLTKTNKEINKITRKLNEVNSQIENLQKDHEELVLLLENIEKYILTNECPVCGFEHESKEVLLKKLKARVGSKNIYLEQLTKSRTEYTKQLRAEKLTYKNLETEMSTVRDDMGSLENNTVTSQNSLQSIKDLANQLNVRLDEGSISDTLKKMLQNATSDKKGKNELIKQSSDTIDELEKKKVSLKMNIKEIDGAIKTTNSLIEKYSNDKKKLDNQNLNEKLTFRNTITEINNAHLKLSRESESHKLKIIDIEKSVTASKKSLQEAKDSLTDLSKKIKAIQKQNTNNENYINVFLEILTGIKLDKNITKNQLTQHIDSLESDIDTINSYLREVNQIEVSLIASQTTALIANLQIKNDRLQNEISKIQNKCKNIELWSIYFEQLVKVLNDTRSKSIEDYIKNLGPLASKIQQRLRAVYNFGEIKLVSDKGDVHVKAQHLDNELMPTDYFSESQIQILILSLFLSAALTQNWSSFSTILLDDPVTHFDDMNCYAFTDLIRGIVDTTDNKYQFIISTCEERLYALMKQKFARMNGKAIFYEFRTIGKDGPVIDNVSLK